MRLKITMKIKLLMVPVELLCMIMMIFQTHLREKTFILLSVDRRTKSSWYS